MTFARSYVVSVDRDVAVLTLTRQRGPDGNTTGKVDFDLEVSDDTTWTTPTFITTLASAAQTYLDDHPEK